MKVLSQYNLQGLCFFIHSLQVRYMCVLFLYGGVYKNEIRYDVSYLVHQAVAFTLNKITTFGMDRLMACLRW